MCIIPLTPYLSSTLSRSLCTYYPILYYSNLYSLFSTLSLSPFLSLHFPLPLSKCLSFQFTHTIIRISPSLYLCIYIYTLSRKCRLTSFISYGDRYQLYIEEDEETVSIDNIFEFKSKFVQLYLLHHVQNIVSTNFLRHCNIHVHDNNFM